MGTQLSRSSKTVGNDTEHEGFEAFICCHTSNMVPGGRKRGSSFTLSGLIFTDRQCLRSLRTFGSKDWFKCSTSHSAYTSLKTSCCPMFNLNCATCTSEAGSSRTSGRVSACDSYTCSKKVSTCARWLSPVLSNFRTPRKYLKSTGAVVLPASTLALILWKRGVPDLLKTSEKTHRDRTQKKDPFNVNNFFTLIDAMFCFLGTRLQ